MGRARCAPCWPRHRPMVRSRHLPAAARTPPTARPTVAPEATDRHASVLRPPGGVVRLAPAASVMPMIEAAASLGPDPARRARRPTEPGWRRFGCAARASGWPNSRASGRRRRRVSTSPWGRGRRCGPPSRIWPPSWCSTSTTRRSRRNVRRRGTPATSPVERARRLGMPCVLVSPVPSLARGTTTPWRRSARAGSGRRARRLAARRDRRPRRRRPVGHLARHQPADHRTARPDTGGSCACTTSPVGPGGSPARSAASWRCANRARRPSPSTERRRPGLRPLRARRVPSSARPAARPGSWSLRPGVSRVYARSSRPRPADPVAEITGGRSPSTIVARGRRLHRHRGGAPPGPPDRHRRVPRPRRRTARPPLPRRRTRARPGWPGPPASSVRGHGAGGCVVQTYLPDHPVVDAVRFADPVSRRRGLDGPATSNRSASRRSARWPP